MRPARIAKPSLRKRTVPQYRLEGCRRWRRTLAHACWDYAVVQFLAKYNCDEATEEIQVAVDDFKFVPHHCSEDCWGKSSQYKIDVCDRYARLLARKLRAS